MKNEWHRTHLHAGDDIEIDVITFTLLLIALFTLRARAAKSK